MFRQPRSVPFSEESDIARIEETSLSLRCIRDTVKNESTIRHESRVAGHTGLTGYRHMTTTGTQEFCWCHKAFSMTENGYHRLLPAEAAASAYDDSRSEHVVDRDQMGC